jgi:hypothetical protein
MATKTKTKQEPKRVTTGTARLSFPFLFQKSKNPDGTEGKYRCTLLIPKKDKQTIAALEKIATDAVKSFERWDEKQQKPMLAKVRELFKNGDDSEYDGYAGHIAVNVSNTRKPTVVGPDLQPIMDREDVYAGCYVRAAVTAFAYDNIQKGVAFSLQGIQKVKDGEPFGSKFKAEEAFDAVDEEEEF